MPIIASKSYRRGGFRIDCMQETDQNGKILEWYEVFDNGNRVGIFNSAGEANDFVDSQSPSPGSGKSPEPENGTPSP